ncbi:MAG TPA: ABC transporter permease subunit [Anaerolineae bacterium]|nr:ABC transporter permease subunit [Anaerolineae bacterium]
MENQMHKAIQLIKRYQYSEARKLLTEIIQNEPKNEKAWLWLTQVAKNDRERLIFLKRVLHINPGNELAQRGIEILQKRMVVETPEIPFKPTEFSGEKPLIEVSRQPAEFTQRADKEKSKEVLVSKIISKQSDFDSQMKEGVFRIRFKRIKIHLKLTWKRLKNSWNVFSQNRLALIGVILLIIYSLMAIAHPILIKTVWPRGIYDPVTGFDLNVINPSPPTSAHLLGTDGLGRDVLSMLLAATTPAFIIGLTAAIVTAVIGIFVAVLSAYFGGWVDGIFSRISDAFLLLPAPLFMIIIGVAFNELKPVTLGVLFGLISGLGGAAITLRAYALTVMAKPFVEATKIAGGSAFQIIRRHLIPHMIPLAATLMMISVIGAVVADAFISYFGITRLYLNWGTMIYTSQAYGSIFGNIEWNVLIPPSIALSMFATSFYLISRGLHEIADPKLRMR